MYKKIIGTLLFLLITTVYAKSIDIVAAENFYGDIAKQMGGEYVAVTSILSNPNQDPHLFSSSPATARAIAAADLVVYNGIDYDPWMENLLKANTRQPQQTIVVADLLGKKSGDNPHIWYDPPTMLLYADQLVKKLMQLDPPHTDYYQQRLAEFKHQHAALMNTISRMKQQFHGATVIATEPVFNYMATALGLTMYGNNFQLSIMNGTEPGARDIRDFEDKLTKHAVKVLIYNNQVINPITDRIKDLATKSGIPTVGVSETQPLNQDYWAWMNSELSRLQVALTRAGN